jgi:NAD+ synthase (glutamine-hydrolysing)
MSTGYTTLYGDLAGGYAVIKDVPKTLVYQLSQYRNALEKVVVIPQNIIDKEPSAELRPNQLDVNSLPRYEDLDPILEAYIEKDKSYENLIESGFDPDIVKRVITLVDNSEYKRRQSPPGVKITSRAFGRDRRLPIVNQYRQY